MGHYLFEGGTTYGTSELQTLINQSALYYSTQAALASAVSGNETEGMVGNVNGSLWGWTGSAWRQFTRLNYVSSYQSQGTGQTVTGVGTGSRVDIAGASVSVEVVKNLPVVATLTVDVQMTADDGEVTVIVMNIGGSDQTGAIIFGNSERLTTSASWVYTPGTTGSVTFKGQAYLNNGSGANCQINAAGTFIHVWMPNVNYPTAP